MFRKNFNSIINKRDYVKRLDASYHIIFQHGKKCVGTVLLLSVMLLSSCRQVSDQARREAAIAKQAADESGSTGNENEMESGTIAEESKVDEGSSAGNDDAVKENGGDAGNDAGVRKNSSDAQSGNVHKGANTGEENEGSGIGENAASESNNADILKEKAWKEKFGENCIGTQTFEVELSEYKGKVYFVPFAPTGNQRDFSIQIIQDDNVLTEIEAYVPDTLPSKSFGSLDAVSFYDVNYDGKTDIVLIETYLNTTFAAVYYGYTSDTDENRGYFMVEEELSDQISKQVEQLTIPEIRNFLSDGKKNGEFADYKEAYEAVGRLCELENTWETEYDLIYFDEDDIPEFVAGHTGYYVSMYTYSDGKIYTVLDHWPYGAFGNMGYEYVPRKNSLRNYNSDYAGAIHYTTYMSVNAQHVMETVAQIKHCSFDDVNQNGYPDGDEEDSIGNYSKIYINGREASDEECAVYDMGEYEFIRGTMDMETLRTKL